MSKLFSNSLLILGIIEDVDIKRIQKAEYFHRSYPIDDLVQSIREKSLLQPIIVRPVKENFEIVAGNRRFDACKNLGWKKIICHIVELNDKESFEISLTENIQRKNLDPIEEARLFEVYVSKLGWGGISELASKIGKSVSYVDRRLRLLDLPSDVVESISHSLLTPSSAEELITVKSKEIQSYLAKLIVEKKLSSRQTKDMVNQMESANDYESFEFLNGTKIIDIDNFTSKIFDKSITILKIASNKLGTLIPEIEENWIIYELLMQHKTVIDNRIDILIKQKRKL